MENTPKKLYEYYLNNGEIKQTECTILSQNASTYRGTIYQYSRENLYGSKFVREEELGVVHNNHIYAFDDDIEKYKAVFITYVEANVKKLQQQLNRNKKILKKLRQ